MMFVKFKIFLSILIILPACFFSQTAILEFSPNLSPTTFDLPLRADIELSPSVSIVQHSHLFQTNYPFAFHLPYKEKIVRWNRVIQTSESFIQFQKDAYSVSLGKMQQGFGPGKLTGVFLSPNSPPIDQLFLKYLTSSFKLQFQLMRLDNRPIGDSNSQIINRWYYLRRLSWSPSKKITISLSEGMVVTGVNRQFEWHYLNPMNPFLLDENHEISNGYLTEEGDSDNALIGFDITYTNNSWQAYTEWVIDEIQIDSEDRKIVQDIFGGLVGMSYTKNEFQLIVEWSYASPWLYLHHGLFTNLEKYGYPLALRTPMGQFLDVSYKNTFNKIIKYDLTLHFEQIGDQNIETIWDAVGNKIDPFGFNGIEDPEVRLEFGWVENTSISFWLSHNQFQNGESHFGIQWHKTFKYSGE